MHPVVKTLIRFGICTAIVFGISYGCLQIINACESAGQEFNVISSVSTAIFLVFAFPLWIMGKGADIFRIDPGIVLLSLLGNAIFYGMIMASWFTYSRKKKVSETRRSVE